MKYFQLFSIKCPQSFANADTIKSGITLEKIKQMSDFARVPRIRVLSEARRGDVVLISIFGDKSDSTRCFVRKLIRRGGVPSGAAAFIITGGMGASAPIITKKNVVFPVKNHFC